MVRALLWGKPTGNRYPQSRVDDRGIHTSTDEGRSEERESRRAASVTNTSSMTTYIPSITLPAFAFAQPAVAVLLPIALGTGIGYSISREAVSWTNQKLVLICQ